jgi:PAS domain-containing protein
MEPPDGPKRATGARMDGRADDDLWREALSKVPFGVWILDPHGRTVFASERLAQMLRARPVDLIGTTSFGDLVEGVGAASPSPGTRPRNGGEGAFGRLRLRCADAHSLLVDVSTRCLVAPDGTPRGLLLIVDEAA